MSSVDCRLSEQVNPATPREQPELSNNPHSTIHKRRAAAGFSLIEILVVIGILAVLISMAVVGFKVVGGVSRDKVTATALENCKSMIAEFETTSSLAELLDAATVTQMHSGPANRWELPLNGQAESVMYVAVTAPGIVQGSTGTPQSSLPVRAVRERYLRDETARVIRRLMSVPKNRASIEAMPPDRMAKVKYPVNPTNTLTPAGDSPEYGSATATVEGPYLLDGHGKPIYFIPGGGLLYVNVGYKGSGDLSDKANYDRQVSVRATDRRPFWASPGADGELTSGDDNVYSSPVELVPN